MQKIRCPHCGVINLEKFITYPQCAGCGSTLPQAAQAGEALPFWRRPVRPVIWVSIVGLLLAGLLWTASVFQVAVESSSQVVVYGDSRRSSRVGQVIALNLRVDALGESRSERKRSLRDVQLRIPLRTFQTLRFVSLQPKPDQMTILGKGRIFTYETLPHDSVLQLRLRVTDAIREPIPVAVYAADHLPGFWRVLVMASPARKKSRR
jgi:hypothetical protein